MPLILPGNVGSATAATGFNVANSCRFDGSSSYMQKTYANGQNKKFSISTWIKRSSVGDAGAIWSGYHNGTNYITLAFIDDDTLRFQNVSAGVNMHFATNRVFRDVSAWYHILAIVDTTDGTAGDRQQIFINGVRETSFSTSTAYAEDDAAELGATDKENIVGRHGSDDDYFDGYMAEHVFIDGLALAADQFGEFDSDSGIWKPIDVSGLTFGTNGYYLDFEASANLGNDANGGTDLTESGLAAIDQSIDTCTNNFATINSLDLYHNATANTGNTSTEGNLKFVIASGNKGFARSTFGVSAGKWYFEAEANAVGKGFYGVCNAGIMEDGTALQTSAVYYYENVPDFRSGDEIVTDNAVSISAGDILGFALDMDNYALYISKNGTYMNSGNPGSGSSRTGAISEEFTTGRAILRDFGEVFANVSNTSTTGGLDTLLNFGSPPYSESGGNADGNGFGNFKTAPPSGYLAFCTKNLAETGG